MKITSRRAYLRPGPPQFKLNNMFNEHFPGIIFCKSILSRKNRRGGNEWLVKLGANWSRLLTMLLPGPDLHCAGLLALWRFSQHLPAKYKKSLSI